MVNWEVWSHLASRPGGRYQRRGAAGREAERGDQRQKAARSPPDQNQRIPRGNRPAMRRPLVERGRARRH